MRNFSKTIKSPLLSIAAGSAALGLLVPREAEASGLTLAVELGPEVVLTQSENDDINRVGLGVAARLGYTFDAPLIALTPEAKLGFQSPGTPNSFSAMGGARLNLFEGISPAVFAHAGGLVGDLSGFVWDAGVGLDFTMLQVVDFGIFGSYSQVGKATFSSDRVAYESSSWHWAQFGAQAAVHF